MLFDFCYCCTDVNETPGAERSPVRRQHQQQAEAVSSKRTRTNPHMDAAIAALEAESSLATGVSVPSTSQQPPAQQEGQVKIHPEANKPSWWPQIKADDEEENMPQECKQS